MTLGLGISFNLISLQRKLTFTCKVEKLMFFVTFCSVTNTFLILQRLDSWTLVYFKNKTLGCNWWLANILGNSHTSLKKRVIFL